MKLKNVVTGAFVGTIMMNVLMPFIITKGATTKEVMLLYTLPLVGALSSFVIEIEKEENLKRRINSEAKENINNIRESSIGEFNISSFLGKNIKIRTYGGALISGILKGVEENLLILSSTKRLDIPESVSSAIIFIDKKDIREIELSSETMIENFK
ncbi:MAG: hypothetical protein QXJ96_00570 [Candidatus Aenigmatarchaeota archaeon]|nr:hypothetical protein [Candidatus Aenigmarchaeota archaeon]